VDPLALGSWMICTDTSTNAAIRAPATKAGSRLPAGCSRITEDAFR
jgi:hypothetical protein